LRGLGADFDLAVCDVFGGFSGVVESAIGFVLAPLSVVSFRIETVARSCPVYDVATQLARQCSDA